MKGVLLVNTTGIVSLLSAIQGLRSFQNTVKET